MPTAAQQVGQAGRLVPWRLAKGHGRKKMLSPWVPMVCRCANAGVDGGVAVAAVAVNVGKGLARPVAVTAVATRQPAAATAVVAMAARKAQRSCSG